MSEGGTEGWRDGGTEGRTDRGTEGQRECTSIYHKFNNGKSEGQITLRMRKEVSIYQSKRKRKRKGERKKSAGPGRVSGRGKGSRGKSSRRITALATANGKKYLIAKRAKAK